LAAICVARRLVDGPANGAALATLHLDPELRVFHIRFARTPRLTIATASLIAAICKERSSFALPALPLVPAMPPAH